MSLSICHPDDLNSQSAQSGAFANTRTAVPNNQTNRTIPRGGQADQLDDDMVFDTDPSPMNAAKPLVRMDLSQLKLP